MFKQLRFILLIWVVFQLLILPFPYQLLPTIGTYYYDFMAPITTKLALNLNVDVTETRNFSDSLNAYINALLLLLPSLVIVALTGTITDLKNQQLIQTIFHTALVTLLSYFLLRYGLDKLFQVQFYTPASNTLHTEIGQLDKDILFWSTMGVSSFYSIFMGITECLAALFLLFKRTRLLGFLVAFGILINVFAINIGFDITVKYFSGLLLTGSAVGLLYYTNQLKVVFGLGNQTTQQHSFHTKYMLLIMLPFFMDLCISYASVQQKSSGESYHVVAQHTISQNTFPQVLRIHIHPENYLIFETKEGKFYSYQLSSTGSKASIDHQWTDLKWQVESLQIGTFLKFHLKKMKLNKLPALRDKTHWYLEQMK